MCYDRWWQTNIRRSQVIINLGAWHGGLTLNDISRDRGRGELGRGWSRGRGPLGLSTDIRWRQSQEHQAPVFSATSPDNCWLHKNVKTAETVAAWLHETGCAQSICPRVTMDKHCTGHWNWHSSVRTQESLHFTAPLFMVTSSSSQVLMVSWCLTPCLHYISWAQLSDRCARALSLWVTQNWIVQNTSRWDLSGVHPQTNTITSPPPAATGWSQNKVIF